MAKSRALPKMAPTMEDVARSYRIPDVRNSSRLFFTVSYLSANWMKKIPLLRKLVSYDSTSNWDDSNEIVKRVWLGRLPSKSNVELPSTVGMVVSAVELYELGENYLIDKYTLEEMNKGGVKQLVVRIPDTTADVSFVDLYNTIVEMKQYLDNHPDKDVYIHCKAGRSRSAMILAIFLAIYGDEYGLKLKDNDYDCNLALAIDHIKEKRPHISIGLEQFDKAREVVQQSTAMLFSNKAHQLNRSDDNSLQYASAHEYLSSLEAKDAMRFLRSFLQMGIYAMEIQHYYTNCQRTEHIREFFNDIVTSKDGAWYDDLLNKTGPVRKLLDADTGDESDKIKRSVLVSNFTDEINQLLDKNRLLVVCRQDNSIIIGSR